MLLRPFMLSAALLAAPIIVFTPDCAVATDKSEARSSILSYEGKAIKTDNPHMVVEQLTKGLIVQSNAESAGLHVVAVKDGRAVTEHSSDTVILRRRPGRMKMVPKEAMPSAEFFNGLAVKDFVSPKSQALFTADIDVGKLAEESFKSVNQTDGIFLVTTFDDMIKGDMTVGLVGFGSWN